MEANQVVKVVVNAEATRAEFTTRDGITGRHQSGSADNLIAVAPSFEVISFGKGFKENQEEFNYGRTCSPRCA